MSSGMRVGKARIRYMVEKDLPAILRMASEEGWLSNLSEFQMFIEYNPFGCFVYTEGDRVIGSVMTFHHTKSAWVGNFIVAKEYRGKGIGKKLFARAIEYLDKKKKKRIYLNAAYEAKKMYEKFGFRKIVPVNRWQGKAVKFANNMESSRETIPDILGFVKVDAFLWKDERFSLISQLSLLRFSRLCLEPPGFLIYGNTGKAVTIGPWEVEGGDEDAAERLFASALSKLKPDKKIFLDVPSLNKKAEKILTKYKFKIIGSTLFMCRGNPPKIRFGGIFSFATMGSMG